MTRHQRRKLARARKDAKAAKLNARAMQVLKEETRKRNLSSAMPKRSPRGLGNRAIYQAVGMYPAPGYTSGAFKEKPLGERALRELRSKDNS